MKVLPREYESHETPVAEYESDVELGVSIGTRSYPESPDSLGSHHIGLGGYCF